MADYRTVFLKEIEDELSSLSDEVGDHSITRWMISEKLDQLGRRVAVELERVKAS